MRHTILLAVALAACAPIHGTQFEMKYEVTPRKLLLDAVDATRELHYSIVAVESPDVYHNTFLAFADQSAARSPDALLVDVSMIPLICPPLTPCKSARARVQVVPMAFRSGRAVAKTDVPATTRAEAEKLMYAIFDRTRRDRDWRAF